MSPLSFLFKPPAERGLCFVAARQNHLLTEDWISFVFGVWGFPFAAGRQPSHPNIAAFSKGCFAAASKRHQSERGAVLLVVIVKLVIEPRAVLFLKRQQDRRQLIFVFGSF